MFVITSKEKVIMNRKNPKDTQNFITSKKHVKQIIGQTNISKTDHVVEIGTGKGHFTEELARISKSVTGIEIDKGLSQMTEEKVKFFENSTIITEDILNYSFPKNSELKIFGNIPYNISTDIVRKITFESQAKYSYLLVEEGFAKRLQNYKRALGLLLMTEMDVEILEKIPKAYFHPIPNVESVLIVLKRHQPLISKKDDNKKYEDFVYKWVNKEYRVLFTKNQFKKAMKYANATDINKLTKEQFISIFNSYKLFN